MSADGCVADGMLDADAGDAACNAVNDVTDPVCQAADAGDPACDAVNDVTADSLSQQPAVDSAASDIDHSNETGTAQTGDGVQTDTLVKDETEKLNNDVQPDSSRVDSQQTWCFADIKKQWRKFNIDLMPKVIKGHSGHKLLL